MAEEVKIEEKVATLETELTTKKDELAKASTKVQELTTELAKQTDELTKLREFKKTTEEAAQRVEKIKGIKSKLDEAGIVADLETEADYWLSMNEDTLTKTIAKMKELAKGAKASASIKVPPVGGVEESDARKIVSEALKERKQAKDK